MSYIEEDLGSNPDDFEDDGVCHFCNLGEHSKCCRKDCKCDAHKATVKMPHLAEVIKEEMEFRHWTITDLIMHMGPHEDEKAWRVCQLSWEMFFAVHDPDIILGDVMAKQLGDAFEVDPNFFTNYHEMWRKTVKPEDSDAH